MSSVGHRAFELPWYNSVRPSPHAQRPILSSHCLVDWRGMDDEGKTKYNLTKFQGWRRMPSKGPFSSVGPFGDCPPKKYRYIHFEWEPTSKALFVENLSQSSYDPDDIEAEPLNIACRGPTNESIRSVPSPPAMTIIAGYAGN
ncbi:hypothetical protein PLEOSDRAFT_1108501 [Pleurotus ostreatus PC15]|uniref:Uncharacterized protein n=1 Tax=Pleurotus ostreatus (strain PC15) TaxID=1137138 RepID=A0A067N864_PLEO1|nr:hypothetical protein PLEOSDRAFT_1108501 [Pleurotus ostreatus PC15]